MGSTHWIISGSQQVRFTASAKVNGSSLGGISPSAPAALCANESGADVDLCATMTGRNMTTEPEASTNGFALFASGTFPLERSQ